MDIPKIIPASIAARKAPKPDISPRDHTRNHIPDPHTTANQPPEKTTLNPKLAKCGGGIEIPTRQKIRWKNGA